MSPPVSSACSVAVVSRARRGGPYTRLGREPPSCPARVSPSACSRTAATPGWGEAREGTSGAQEEAMHLLLVEDNPADVVCVRRALRDLPGNIAVSVMPNGRHALAFLHRWR